MGMEHLRSSKKHHKAPGFQLRWIKPYKLSPALKTTTLESEGSHEVLLQK